MENVIETSENNNSKMDDTGASPGISATIPSPKFVIKERIHTQEETITIDGTIYNKKDELKKLEMLIRTISNEVKILNEIMGGNTDNENDSSLPNVIEAHSEFPIETHNDLIAFENNLKENSGYRVKVIERIRKETAKYGNLNRKVKEALNVILDRNLARTINWTGLTSRNSYQKIAFRGFRNIIKILMSVDDYFAGEKAVKYAIQIYFHTV